MDEEAQLKKQAEEHYHVIIDSGDQFIAIAKETVPIDHPGYIYVRLDYDAIGTSVVADYLGDLIPTLEKTLDAASDVIGEVENLADDIHAMQKVFNKWDHKGVVLKGWYERTDKLLSDSLRRAKLAQRALESIDHVEEPDWCMAEVGIVSPGFAGEELVARLMEASGTDMAQWEEPMRTLGICQELIGYGARAVVFDKIYADPVHALRDALKEAEALPTVVGFALDQEMNAIGATGWDFMADSITEPGGFRKRLSKDDVEEES